MTHFCEQRRPCVVQASKTFMKDVIIRGHINVQDGSTVQGVDVSEAFKLAVTKDTGGNIPGLTTFTGGLTITSVLHVMGLVDGMNVTSEHLLTKTHKQIITAPLTIITPNEYGLWAPEVRAQDGLFNGLNLTKLLSSAFRLDVSITVNASLTSFTTVMFAEPSYDNVFSLAEQLPIDEDLEPYAKAFFNLGRASSMVSWAIAGAVREFWGWRLVQRFSKTTARLIALRLDWDTDDLLVGIDGGSAGASVGYPSASSYLALVTKFGDAKILLYSNVDDQYYDTGILLSGKCTKAMVGYRHQEAMFLVTGHACSYEYNITNRQSFGDEQVLVYIITPNNQASIVSTFPTPGAADIQMLWQEHRACLVVVEARGPDTVIMCEGESPGYFVEHQRLRTGNPRKASVARHQEPSGHNFTYLAVADPGTDPDHRGAFYVWRSDTDGRTFRNPQEVGLHSVLWVELMSHSSDLFLVVVLEAFRGDHKGAVIIYRMDWFSQDGLTPLGHLGTPYGGINEGYWPVVHRPSFYFLQELRVEHPLEARFSLLPSGQLVLYIINEKGLITRFSQKGIHRFWQEGELHMHKKLTFETWVMRLGNGTLVHRISVAGQKCIGMENLPDEPAEVLEAIFRGGSFNFAVQDTRERQSYAQVY